MRLFICILFAVAAAFAACAEERYALLIGNEDYPATVGPLSLPHEDVENIRSGLIQAGFPAENIRVLKDANQIDINLAVAQLATNLKSAGGEAIGFFYYSGHGGSAESAGQRANYLIPAKTPVTGAEQLPILGVPVNSIVDTLAATDAKAIFVVSDACRNTLPFTSSKGGTGDKGMVRVPRKRGLFIAFATADGATTPDDGLFSRALSKRLSQRGLSADRVFTLALREVAAARPGNAMPFTADGLSEDICFTSCDAGAVSASLDPDEADWQRFGVPGTIKGYANYITLHPNGSHVADAREKLVYSYLEDSDEWEIVGGDEPDMALMVALLEASYFVALSERQKGVFHIAAELLRGVCDIEGYGVPTPNKYKACAVVGEMYYAGEIEGVSAERTSTYQGRTSTTHYLDRSFEAREKEAARFMKLSCNEGYLPSACDWLAEKGLN